MKEVSLDEFLADVERRWREHFGRLDFDVFAQRIEARSDETLQAAQPEGREPDGEADAPTPYRPTPTGEE